MRLNFLLVARYFILVARYFLLAARYFLLVGRYFLLVARYFCLLLVTFCSMLVTFCSLPVTFCSLFCARCSLLFTRCSLFSRPNYCEIKLLWAAKKWFDYNETPPQVFSLQIIEIFVTFLDGGFQTFLDMQNHFQILSELI